MNKQVNVIGLNSQGKDRPSILITFFLNQLFASLSNRTSENWLTASWTPDQVIDDQVNTMFIRWYSSVLFMV